MKKQLLTLGAFLVLALGALPSLAACPCQCQGSWQSVPCCPARTCCPATVCCPAPAIKPCCPAPVCCPAPACCPAPCPAAPCQNPCCEKANTCNDCCD